MRQCFFGFIFLGSILSTGCSSIPGVYSIDIEQGNRINQEMINQLRATMTKRQILYIMGSPMLRDVFHKERWDYLYSSKKDGQDREQKRISLYFKDDMLTSIQGDFKPNTQVEKLSKDVTVDVPKRDLDKTMWEKIVWLFTPAKTTQTANVLPVQKIKPKNVTKSVNIEANVLDEQQHAADSLKKIKQLDVSDEQNQAIESFEKIKQLEISDEMPAHENLEKIKEMAPLSPDEIQTEETLDIIDETSSPLDTH
jgi:outer membrane protein assembly factor BamE